jgi:hypothetical protein
VHNAAAIPATPFYAPIATIPSKLDPVSNQLLQRQTSWRYGGSSVVNNATCRDVPVAPVNQNTTDGSVRHASKDVTANCRYPQGFSRNQGIGLIGFSLEYP